MMLEDVLSVVEDLNCELLTEDNEEAIFLFDFISDGNCWYNKVSWKGSMVFRG